VARRGSELARPEPIGARREHAAGLSAADRARLLFVNHGPLGWSVLGAVSVEQSLRAGLASVPDVDATFLRLPPAGVATRALSHPIPGLEQADVDFHTTRWHLVESWRGRRAMHRALARAFDAVHVTSHTAAFFTRDLMEQVPVYVCVDVPVLRWRTMAIDRPLRPWSRAMLAPSLAMERRVLEACAGVVALSDWTADAVHDAAPRANVAVIHPGVAIPSHLCRSRRGADVPHRLLFVGGRFEGKGGPDLIEAVAPLLGSGLELDVVTAPGVPRVPGVRYHHVGPGSTLGQRLYQRADLLCLPTKGDAVPWTVLEAMAHGVPVVATPIGAIGELIEASGAGVLVPPGDRERLRAAIIDLLADPARRREMACRGRTFAETHYSRDRQAAELVAFLTPRHERSPLRGRFP
jgi:glycosyltransferase involved in cell wall biosynthesis